MSLTEKQRAALAAPLNERLVREHPYIRSERTGQKALYLPIQDVLLGLTEVFGADGWTREIVKIERVHGPVQVEKKDRNGKPYLSWQTTWMAQVNLVLREGGVYAGASGHTAYSTPPNPPNDRQAIEAAVSFATKQAAKLLGPRFGLLLGDEEDPYGEGWADYLAGMQSPPPAATTAPAAKPGDSPFNAGAPDTSGASGVGSGGHNDAAIAPDGISGASDGAAAGMTPTQREELVAACFAYARGWRRVKGAKPPALLPYANAGALRALDDRALAALATAVEQESTVAGIMPEETTP